MTTKLNTNGQARKSLAEQIDRLDAVLDGLAEGINDTVVAAVKEAVGAAVQAVLREVLSSPELLARLAVAVPAATQKAEKPKASWKQRCSALQGAADVAGGGPHGVRTRAGVRPPGVRPPAGPRAWLGGRLVATAPPAGPVQVPTGDGPGRSAWRQEWRSTSPARGWRRRPAASAAFAATLAVQAGVALKRLLTQIAGPVT